MSLSTRNWIALREKATAELSGAQVIVSGRMARFLPWQVPLPVATDQTQNCSVSVFGPAIHFPSGESDEAWPSSFSARSLTIRQAAPPPTGEAAGLAAGVACLAAAGATARTIRTRARVNERRWCIA